MQPSRRQVLRLGVVAAATAGPFALAERAIAAVTPARLVRKTFTPRVGSTFRFADRGSWYTATLVSVGDLSHSRAGDQNRFQLMFAVRGSGPGQGTYRFQHGTLAPFQLFVVPVGGGRRRYEAIVVSPR